MKKSQTAHIVVTVDVIIVYGDCALFIRRGKNPYQGLWAIPGGKLNANDTTLEAATLREVHEETGVFLQAGELEQVHTFGNIERDPRGRYINVVYTALLNDRPQRPQARAGDDARAVEWIPLHMLPVLAFDHMQIMEYVFGSRCRFVF